MKYVLGLMAFFIGCAAGVWFPDIDQRIGLLEHRSILTHGPLLPIVLFAVASESESIPLRWVAMGACIGVAVHLAFDLSLRVGRAMRWCRCSLGGGCLQRFRWYGLE